MLYIIPTPIGNLEDITLRAIKLLKEVDCILCEDTRTSSKLLNHYQITTRTQPFHQHNEHQQTPLIVQRLMSGETIAMITDAGTPGISDPAFLLVRACIKSEIKVECLPGATAFVPALVCSGFPTNQFYFEGFLPQKKGRQTRLKQLAIEEKTIVFYESPNRLLKLLEEIKSYIGEKRMISVSREISKLHEEHKRGTATELVNYFSIKEVKGEIVVVLEGKIKDSTLNED